MDRVENLVDEYFHLSKITPEKLETVRLDEFFKQFQPMTKRMQMHFMYYLLEKMNVQNYPKIYNFTDYESWPENP